jgi:hypothetical protein
LGLLSINIKLVQNLTACRHTRHKNYCTLSRHLKYCKYIYSIWQGIYCISRIFSKPNIFVITEPGGESRSERKSWSRTNLNLVTYPITNQNPAKSWVRLCIRIRSQIRIRIESEYKSGCKLKSVIEFGTVLLKLIFSLHDLKGLSNDS